METKTHTMKNKYLLPLILLMLCCSTLTFAQKSNPQQVFLKGKDFYKNKKYLMAMEVFRPFTENAFNSDINPYAQFYYGLSAYQAGQKEVARNTFRNLSNSYPSWKQIDEVQFWLGRSYLEEGNYASAFANFAKIKNSKTKQQAQAFQGLNFEKIDLFKLQGLQERFPSEAGLGEALANKIIQQPITEQDRELLAKLVADFKLDGSRYAHSDIRKSERKAVYHVAVMLPFRYDTTHQYQNRKNFSWQIYEGVKQAKEQLGRMGIQIQLMAYDTYKDEAKTREFLNDPALKKVDLIIGPLYPGPSKAVTEFSFAHQINMINPISQNTDIIAQNPFSFLMKPSSKTVGIAAGQLVKKTMPEVTLDEQLDTLKQNVVIVYTDNSNDSTTAYNYMQQLESTHYHINHILKIRKGEEQSVINYFTEKEEVAIPDSVLVTLPEDAPTTEEKFVIRQDSIDQVMVASSNANLAASVLSALTTRDDNISLIGEASWLSNPQMPLDAITKLDTYLMAPNYIDTESNSYQAFAQRYTEKANQFPTKFVCAGYEALFTFGKMMNEFGNRPQLQLTDGPVKGALVNKHIFYSANDDRCVPVLHFEDGDFKMVDQVIVKTEDTASTDDK
ncbi:tetratricopeptide repeat protein [Persicobacter psychrovividus]|uniref:Leucine-binding protein domain-containing protein n=1 Tax=Persicobacter psychrovividus TaxID=387638 RepID=A0ABN6LEP9_9BACT|nr:hypothetical protein PEPS_21890 [Persicobacter psychrovividus]